MSLRDEVDKVAKDVGLITSHLKDEEVKRVKKKDFKLPFGVRMKGKRAVKQGKLLAIMLHSNHSLSFKVVKVVSGLIEVNNTSYKAYEEGAIFHYKRFSVVVILEWRLTLVGGKTDFKFAKENHIADFGQDTLISMLARCTIKA